MDKERVEEALKYIKNRYYHSHKEFTVGSFMLYYDFAADNPEKTSRIERKVPQKSGVIYKKTCK